MRILPLLAATSLLAACQAQQARIADAPPAAASAAPAVPAVPPLDEALMKDAVRTLSSDAFEGRAPGSAGEEKTVAYMVEQFRKAGLQPGNKGSWTQDVPLVEIEAQRTSNLTVKGKGATLAFRPGDEFVGVTYREAPRIALKDSELVFVGYGINAPERGWNDYAGLDVKGKTVVILINDPDFGTEGLDGPFGGRAMTYYGRWTYKFEEAARQGAAGALIIHDTAPASYGWNVVESSWTGPQFYPQSANGNADQTMVNGWVQMATAKAMFDAAGQDLPALMAAAKRPGFRAVPLGLTASLSFDNRIAKAMSKNIVGLLPGRARPDEVVLYTAHWDHLGRCKPAPDGDDICNGAIDNATGTAALAAIAKAHVAAGVPDRSILFVAVTAEESGLLGSKYYAANPIFPLAKTVGGVNMDALSMAGPAKNVVVVGRGKSDLDAYLDAAVAADGRVATPEPTPEKGFYYRSDHFSLARLGVPMLYFDGGDDLVTGGRAAAEAAAADYTENRYHGPKDEYDPAWDWSGLMRDLRVYYRVGRMLAETTEWPNWNEGDEFRATRDASRAGM